MNGINIIRDLTSQDINENDNSDSWQGDWSHDWSGDWPHESWANDAWSSNQSS